jgi:asparagine synthase (glutamine-hydrolysing)
VRGDKMTMAASIEGRMPLLDHDLAEYAARLPAELKAPPGVARSSSARSPDGACPTFPSVTQESWLRRSSGVLVPGRPRRRARAVGSRSGGPSRPLGRPGAVRKALALHRVGRYDLGKEL